MERILPGQLEEIEIAKSYLELKGTDHNTKSAVSHLQRNEKTFRSQAIEIFDHDDDARDVNSLISVL